MASENPNVYPQLLSGTRQKTGRVQAVEGLVKQTGRSRTYTINGGAIVAETMDDAAAVAVNHPNWARSAAGLLSLVCVTSTGPLD